MAKFCHCLYGRLDPTRLIPSDLIGIEPVNVSFSDNVIDTERFVRRRNQ
jgi:hypothetical protein